MHSSSSPRLRIAHLILSSGFAGSERSTVESCNAQVTDHDVLLVLRKDHRSRAGASIRDHLDARVQVAEVPPRWFTGKHLVAALREFRAQVAHAHLRRSVRSLAAAKVGAKTVATLHLHINGRQFLDMDAIVCIARWQLETIPPSYRGKAVLIPESLVPHRRLAPNEIESLRREVGAAAGDYLIGGVGRMAHSKGWDLLLHAFQQANLPQAKLVLVGEGRERPKLMRMAGRNVKFLGHRDDVKDFYQAFDLTVCPSRREPLGRVILEALDGSVPVLASRAQGPQEILTEYPGDLFPVEDVAALAQALRDNYERGRRRVQVDLSKHHLETVNKALVELYRAILPS